MPDFTQNLNRYTYGLNNPLKYTDPSGYYIYGHFPQYNNIEGAMYPTITPSVGSPVAFNYGWEMDFWYGDNMSEDGPGYFDMSLFSSFLGFMGYIGGNPNGGGGPGLNKNSEEYKLGSLGINLNDNSSNNVSSADDFENAVESVGGPKEIVSSKLLWSLYFHYQFGNGKLFTIESSILDFSYTRQTELGLNGMKYGEKRDVNLFDAGINENSLAFGKVSMTYYGNNNFYINGDNFDFNFINRSGAFFRNTGTLFAGLFFGRFYNTPIISPFTIQPNFFFGGSFPIFFKGLITIPQ